MTGKACVIGSGPNGLAAAIVLAEAGLSVDIFEAEPTAGGAARTLELTLPGFLHDFGSAVHPLAVGSPFFNSLPLQQYGLQWIQSPAVLAHPFDDGTAITLERDLHEAEVVLGVDGPLWRKMMEPFSSRWTAFAPEVLRPVLAFPHQPWMLGRFGLLALIPTVTFIKRFRNPRTQALFGGLAAHSFLSLKERLSTAFGLILAIAGHAVGWPIPRGGAQAVTDALCHHLRKFQVQLSTSRRVEDLASLGAYDVMMCDVTPQQLLALSGKRLSPGYKRALRKFRSGPGIFKVDYALNAPIPWKAIECHRAATVHVGGSFAEIAAGEEEVQKQGHPERPFVLLSQPTLFDHSRVPSGKEIAWCYCHVPNGSSFDMLPRIEAQIERFAPGFRDCILARRVFSPASLEEMDSNLIGGDISGGAVTMRQFLLRPTWRQYATSSPGLFLCSSSTPPGGGAHGMCGYHAAKAALRRLKPSPRA